ncbi:hypothetical protein J1782_08545 [Rahnella sp. BCC 1045]|uniref:hypothetical protein n=1 Tax=Rahnella sp. BCC 1045 TaxID=2816251 RepID=UPI001C2609BB|nr:hypothetical protein [Rahnella sp. BCC 1045]MBU9819935.1 hypothetical protein [Rahnella sp. BCC 1045]
MIRKFEGLPQHVQASALSVIEQQFSSLRIFDERNQEHANTIVKVVRAAYLKLYEEESEEAVAGGASKSGELKNNIMVHGGIVNVGCP